VLLPRVFSSDRKVFLFVNPVIVHGGASMNIRQFAWLLLIIGILLILNLPVQYGQTNGFPTYQYQEPAVNQIIHIVKGTTLQDNQLSVNVTLHQDKFYAPDRFVTESPTGEHPIISFLEGYVTVSFNLTQEGWLYSEGGGLGQGSFFASSPNGQSMGSSTSDLKPGTYYLVTPFFDQTPGGGDFQFRAYVDVYVTEPNPSLFSTIELSVVGAAILAISGCILMGVKRGTLLILLPLLIIVLAIFSFTAAQSIPNPKQYPTVYIRPDGSIQGTDRIVTHDNASYFLVDDINASLIVQKDHTVIDGAGHTIQGAANGTGIDLTDRNNVTVTNTNIRDFKAGIHLQNSTGCSITNNLMLNNTNGIEALEYSTGNTISTNNISSNGIFGIYLWYAPNNKILDNYFSGNAHAYYGAAIELDWYSDYNKIVGNNMLETEAGVSLYGSTNETIFHNNFDGNQYQFQYLAYVLPNNLDNGYPSGGNYWSDYTGVDVKSGPNQDQNGSDGIGDNPYVIVYEREFDVYPLMNPYGLNETYALTILPADNGLTNPPANMYTHLENAQVNVTAHPEQGYVLSHWLLNGQEKASQATITIVLNANYTLQPVFVYLQPPTMGQCTQNPPADNVQENQIVTVSQIITVIDGLEPPQTVDIGYSVTNGSAWAFNFMLYNNATGAWEGRIPGQPTGTRVEYLTKAFTSAGSVVTNDNNGQYYTYTVK
jgi:parallel beta-helix repeat protein